jgi:hypothetical protein
MAVAEPQRWMWQTRLSANRAPSLGLGHRLTFIRKSMASLGPARIASLAPTGRHPSARGNPAKRESPRVESPGSWRPWLYTCAAVRTNRMGESGAHASPRRERLATFQAAMDLPSPNPRATPASRDCPGLRTLAPLGRSRKWIAEPDAEPRKSRRPLREGGSWKTWLRFA